MCWHSQSRREERNEWKRNKKQISAFIPLSPRMEFVMNRDPKQWVCMHGYNQDWIVLFIPQNFGCNYFNPLFSFLLSHSSQFFLSTYVALSHLEREGRGNVLLMVTRKVDSLSPLSWLFQSEIKHSGANGRNWIEIRSVSNIVMEGVISCCWS